jgi:hypothetical protein
MVKENLGNKYEGQDEEILPEEISTWHNMRDVDSNMADAYKSERLKKIRDQIERAEFVLEWLTGTRKSVPGDFNEKLRQKWKDELLRESQGED